LLLRMRPLNVDLWRQVKRWALESGTSLSELLNRILGDCLERRELSASGARERARRGRGVMSDISPAVSLADELHALRQSEVEREHRPW